jgi:hypothetical protein
MRDKPDLIRRFIEQAQIGGQLQHPGIVPIYELGAFADRLSSLEPRLDTILRGQDVPRRRREPFKLNLEVLEARQLLSHGGGPLAALLVIERLDVHAQGERAHNNDRVIELWTERHEHFVERLWAHHPRWAEAVVLPKLTTTNVSFTSANNNRPPRLRRFPLLRTQRTSLRCRIRRLRLRAFRSGPTQPRLAASPVRSQAVVRRWRTTTLTQFFMIAH